MKLGGNEFEKESLEKSQGEIGGAVKEFCLGDKKLVSDTIYDQCMNRETKG